MKAKKVKKVRVSKKGFNTTIFFEDGDKVTIPFENFLKCFGDYRKAVYEYMTYVFMSSCNRSDLAHKVVKEIKTKLLPT